MRSSRRQMAPLPPPFPFAVFSCFQVLPRSASASPYRNSSSALRQLNRQRRESSSVRGRKRERVFLAANWSRIFVCLCACVTFVFTVAASAFDDGEGRRLDSGASQPSTLLPLLRSEHGISVSESEYRRDALRKVDGAAGR